MSFIEKTIIDQGETFVTQKNAFEIGRYLFNAHKKGVLQDNHYEKLKNLKVLTKQKSLISASKSFLSDFYEPDLRIESVNNSDIFISEKYFERKDLKSEWKTFFVKIGVNEKIGIQRLKIERRNNIVEQEYFNEVCSEARQKATFANYFPHLVGENNNVTFDKITYSELAGNYLFSVLFWNEVFKSISPDEISNDAYLHWGYYGSTWQVKNYFFWSLENSIFIPTTQNRCLKASQVYSNAIPKIYDIAGSYLPVFKCEGVVPPDWQRYLNFITTLGLDDYLQILTRIWMENSQDDQVQKENQNRIGLIYENLTLMNLHSSEKEKIKEWSVTNKLLSKNGIDFYFPHELSIVTDGGFRASNLAFTGKQSPEVIELMRLFGVHIIDNVKAYFSDYKVETVDIKNKLLQTSPLIALVAFEKSKNRKEWENEYERISKKLLTIQFFETTEIFLSYGNEDDKQKRSSWADNDSFYYVGKWYTPRVLDSLVEPLGSFLKIRYAERILTVLLLETFADGVEYLKEKGFDTSLIPAELLNPKDELILTNTIGSADPEIDDFLKELGRKGELIVFQKLKHIYSKKYHLGISETETGFKVGNYVEVFWKNISENTTANHDFRVIELGKEIYIDSKATSYSKNVEKVALYISGRELELMETAEKYLIARVYNALSENPTVEFVSLQIDCVTD